MVASLTLPKWGKETYVVGERTTFIELLKVAEELRARSLGFCKMRWRSVQREGLQNFLRIRKRIGKEQVKWIVAIFGRTFATARCDLRPKPTINEDFSDIRASVRELFTEAWKK